MEGRLQYSVLRYNGAFAPHPFLSAPISAGGILGQFASTPIRAGETGRLRIMGAEYDAVVRTGGAGLGASVLEFLSPMPAPVAVNEPIEYINRIRAEEMPDLASLGDVYAVSTMLCRSVTEAAEAFGAGNAYLVLFFSNSASGVFDLAGLFGAGFSGLASVSFFKSLGGNSWEDVICDITYSGNTISWRSGIPFSGKAVIKSTTNYAV